MPVKDGFEVQTVLEDSSFTFATMNSWYYISVWLHIIGGAFWIGGMLFLPLVLLPGIKDHPDRRNLLMATGLRFRFYGYIVLSIMLITGLLNIYLRGISFSWKIFTESRYGSIVSFKILLFISIILLSLFHDFFASQEAMKQMQDEKMKLIARWTGRILLLVSLVMAYLGVLLSRGG